MNRLALAMLAACASLALPPSARGTPSAASGSAPPATSPDWVAIAPGLETRRVEAPAGADPAWVVLVRADLARYRVDVVRPGSAGATAEEVASASNAAVVINGGFFDASHAPIGWLVQAGRELSKPSKAGWGALVTREDAGGARASIVPAARMGGEGIWSAVQAGPRLVDAGVPNASLKEQSARRSFVGIDPRGRLVLGSTGLFSSDARKLAAWLAKPESEGGAGLAHALNLDGGSSSQLWVRGGSAGGGDLTLPGVPVPDLIALVPRK